MNSLLLLTVFLALCCMVHSQRDRCNTPAGTYGRCTSLYNCPPLLTIVNSGNISPQDRDLLRQSHCGFDGQSPKVCCPQAEPPRPPNPPPPPSNNCFTPERKPGRCIGLHSCPTLVNLLNPPVPEENINFVKRSICNGPDQYSVCCGPPPTFKESQSGTGQNQHCMTAFPPDPSSSCCGLDANNGNKIYGGIETSIDQYPWMALIEYEKNNNIKTLCAGSLISGRYVLTAAHCVVGPVLKSGKPVRIRLAEYDTNVEGPDCAQVDAGGQDCTEGTTVIPIERIIAHPQYDPTMVARHHDIALIRMNRVAIYSDFIRPICLPKTDIKLRSEVNFTTAGWGAIDLKKRSSNIKLHVDLPYVPLAQCQPPYKQVLLWKGQLCAGGVKNKDSCKGDSGGPLMFENERIYELTGVVSFGQRECGLENVPAVYTHVYEYDSWIRSNISP